MTREVAAAPRHDVVIRDGALLDGSGDPPLETNIVIDGGRISAISQSVDRRGHLEISARGRAVEPGFIHMFSWAAMPPLADGQLEAAIRQGESTAP